ncbi:MAG: arginine deiminase family protein [Sulfolobaceae archaeon]|nr:arginine deiminase family protein [Sulfolobaceae archaeon]
MIVKYTSEFARLTKVLVHTPSDEIDRLTPKNYRDLLFDDIPDKEEMKREHDEFKQILRNNGVEVLDVKSELSKLRKEELLNILEQYNYCNIPFSSLDVPQLVNIVINGLTIEEAKKLGYEPAVNVDDEFCIPPIPNILFTRDPGIIVKDSYIVSNMKFEARKREPSVLRAIVSPEKVITVKQGVIEGGDVMPIVEGVTLFGFGVRSEVKGLTEVLKKLKEYGDLDEAILLRIETPEARPGRAMIHLDSILGIPSDDIMVYYRYVDNLKVYVYKNKEAELQSKNLIEVMRDYLGRDLRPIRVGEGTYFDEEREHWLLASNFLTINNGVVVSFEHNRLTNRLLEENGVKVLTFRGNELIKGGGGPRCMSLPVVKA